MCTVTADAAIAHLQVRVLRSLVHGNTVKLILAATALHQSCQRSPGSRNPLESTNSLESICIVGVPQPS